MTNERTESQLQSTTSTDLLAIIDDMLTDSGAIPLHLNELNVTLAGKTETGAVFVSHVYLGHSEDGVIADARSDWNDFDYFNTISQQIRPLTVCEEHAPEAAAE